MSPAGPRPCRILHLHVEGRGAWTVCLGEGPARVEPGVTGLPDAVLRLLAEDLPALVETGDRGLALAGRFAEGRVGLEGDLLAVLELLDRGLPSHIFAGGHP